jgi:hypothetical protein
MKKLYTLIMRKVFKRSEVIEIKMTPYDKQFIYCLETPWASECKMYDV